MTFARKQTIAPVALDLNRNIEGMLKMLRRLIGEDLDLAWQPGVDLWPVRMDPVQVSQVLANLCVNARDAIADVGHVTIATANTVLDEASCAHRAGVVPGEYVMLSVSDDGSGMEPEILTQIFEPFFTSKELGRGTGLGLSTVYGIVQQADGCIDVASEPGKGTTFSIYLRRHQGSPVEIAPGPVADMPLGHDETVLVVEDEPALLELAEEMLTRLGYRVLTAGTPGEALALAAEHRGGIQLLITDVIMPEMNGRSLASRLLADHPEMAILFMSGYTVDVILNRQALGRDVDFLHKPFAILDLATKARDTIDRAAGTSTVS